MAPHVWSHTAPIKPNDEQLCTIASHWLPTVIDYGQPLLKWVAYTIYLSLVPQHSLLFLE